MLVIALALADTGSRALSGSEAARVIAESIGYGVLTGAVAGLAVAVVQRRAAVSFDEERVQWRWFLTPVAAAFAFGLATPLGGSGFIAAFVAGLVFGAASGRQTKTAEPLPAQDFGTLLNAVTFVFFGAAFIKPLIERATWQDGVYSLLSLTVVRMVPVAIALLGTRSRAPTVMYVGWFGPRQAPPGCSGQQVAAQRSSPWDPKPGPHRDITPFGRRQPRPQIERSRRSAGGLHPTTENDRRGLSSLVVRESDYQETTGRTPSTTLNLEPR